MESVGRLMLDLSFYTGRRILVTGHTGFKGSWLTYILAQNGAKVIGVALDPPTSPNMFEAADIGSKATSNYIGDIRDYQFLRQVFQEEKPEIVFHLAAQPIVRTGYEEPLLTYETNVMGTANLLECCRLTESVKSILNVTTDKVYKNREWIWGYRERDELDGFDPYSNSKSCSELITASFKRSFFDEMNVPVSTARAGNVIGGGDFAKDRIIPDCFRAAESGITVRLRNPNSTRPYQHVLESIFAYLLIVEKQYFDPGLAGNYNVGPDDCDCATTGDIAKLFCDCWGNVPCETAAAGKAPHEAGFLKLDNTKMKSVFGWSPTWHLAEMTEATVQWYRSFLSGKGIAQEMNYEIKRFMDDCAFIL